MIIMKNKEKMKSIIKNMKRHKIIMKISEAIERLEHIKNSNFRKELYKYPSNYWLVEGDVPKKDGSPQFFIVENNEENNRSLAGHTPIDLQEYGVEV